MTGFSQQMTRFVDRLRGSVSVLALGAVLTAAAAGQSTNWLGNTADWSTVGNWSNGIPGTSTAVVFSAPTPNSPTVSGNAFPLAIQFTGTANQSITGFTLLRTGDIVNHSNYVAAFYGTTVSLQDGSVVRADNGSGGGITFYSSVNATASSQLTFDAVNGVNTITLVSGINNLGNLIKTGAGTLTLAGTNSYTGTTTISAGTLALSGSGSIAASSGVENDGIFDISASTGGTSIVSLRGGGQVNLGGQMLTLTNATDTFAGSIQGTGGVTLSGYGETFTGANTYTGVTTISGSTLNLGNGGSSGSIAGSVIDNGTLTFNRSDAVTFGGAISGSGAVSQEGTGTTVLTGNSTYTGVTYIEAGELGVASGGTVNGTSYTFLDAGSLTVTGAGSSFTTPGDLVAGRGFGSVAVTVADGGQLTTGRSFIGERGMLTNATGLTALVTGPGSVWDTGSSFFLGADTGSPVSLTISDGGVMRVESDLYSSIIGYSGAASATVTGANSQLIASGDAALILGGTAGGAGTLTIENGGLVAAPGIVIGAYDPATSGVLNVNGTAGARGVLETSSLAKDMGSAAVSFDGGILRATADNSAFISGFAPGEFILQTGGMIIDTNGFTDTVLSDLGGGGALTKVGAGTLILSTETSYAGGTTISAGTLQLGDGGTAGSIVGDVTNNGALAFNRSDAVTFGGAISGSGSVSQIGTGTTILTANNTYAGGTTISAGTLQLGNGGASGSIVGDVINNGALAFNRSDAVTFGGAISGSGSVWQIGSGTTILTANNSYSGGTTISAGTLRGSATSFGTGPIQNEAALVIDQPADAAFANAIQGTGSFTKTGTGRLNYTGTGGLTGPTMIAAGTLSMNGSLAASAVTVLSGGTLGGNGTIGPATVLSGGTVAPGNSIGNLHINGNFVQTGGSIYQVQVDPNSNASDLISVKGSATLASGAVLNVSKIEPGNYRQGAIYTVLDASDGRSGTYTATGDTMGVSAFLGLRDTYDANHAYLSVVQIRDPADAAQTANQKAVASDLPATGTVRDAILNAPTDTAARQGFNQLAGDSHAAAEGILVADSHLVRDVTIDRVRALFGSCGSGHQGHHQPESNRLDSACMPAGAQQLVWAQGFGAWGHAGGDGNSSSLGRSTAGVLAGLDMPVARAWRLGGFLGYGHSNLSQNGGASSADIANYHFGVYGGTQYGALGLRFGAAYTKHEIQTERSVTLPTLSQDLRAGYLGHTIQGYAEIGYRVDGERISIEPFADMAYVTLHTNGFTELGGDTALIGLADDNNNTFSTIGVRPSGNLVLGASRLTLRGLLGWRHAFGTVIPASALIFAQGSGAFDVEGAPIARDAGVLELGVDFRASRNVTLGFTYGTQAANRNLDQSVRADVAVKF